MNPFYKSRFRNTVKKIATKKWLLLFFIFAQCSFAQQWGITYLPHQRVVNSIKIFNANSVIVAGGNEENDSLRDIFKSNDGGLTWDFSENKIASWVKSMAFKNASTGYAVGYGGLFLKSTNGGSSFTPLSLPVTRELHKIVYADSSKLFIVGGRKKGTDTLQTIFKSVDGGDHWSVMIDRYGFWLRSVYFTDTMQGIAVGDSGTILKTIDGGVTWNTVASPSTSDLYDVVFTNAATGYIVGGKRQYTNPIRTILKTTNGGASWNIIMEEQGGQLADVSFLNDSVGYAVGDSASFFKTTNRGVTWMRQTITTASGFEQLKAVEFFNENLGYVSGRYALVYVYSNTPAPQAIAVGAAMTSETAATLKALVNTYGFPATFTFNYSLHADFSTYISDYESGVTSNSLIPIQMDVNGLLKDTTYYFFVSVRNLKGVFFK